MDHSSWIIVHGKQEGASSYNLYNLSPKSAFSKSSPGYLKKIVKGLFFNPI